MLNPNLASAWFFSGWIKVWLGEPELAIEHEARAMRLSPHDPLIFNMQAATACAHFFAGRYAEALSWAEKAALVQPQFVPPYTVAAASSALTGDTATSAKAIARVRQLDPSLCLSNLHELFPDGGRKMWSVEVMAVERRLAGVTTE